MPHKLLLADDSVTIQRVIELTFADEDVQVLAVGDGKKAIESIQSDRPDIVLADVGMPERDGYDVAEFIKRNPQLANIPVLLLTGAFEPIDESRARAVGCDGVLVKPFEPQMVINRVKDLLAGRRSGGLWGAKPAPPPPEGPPAPVEQDAHSQPAPPAPAAASASLEEYFDRLDAAFASVEAATEARSVAAIPQPSSTVSIPFGSQTTSAPGLSSNDLPGWDPDLTGDPQRLEPALAAPIQTPVVEPPVVQRPAPIPLSTAPATHEAPPPPATVSMPRPAVDAPVAAPETPSVVTKSPSSAPSPAGMPLPGTASVPSLADAFAALLSAEQGRRVSPSTAGSSAISDEAIEEIVGKVIARMSDRVVRDAVLDVAERLVREEIDRIKAH
ncbi:MAG TPA: response regulator [Vicinamibacterales bacterium]|nr:response regulator [Vicinamibacterales bacterium]